MNKDLYQSYANYPVCLLFTGLGDPELDQEALIFNYQSYNYPGYALSGNIDNGCLFRILLNKNLFLIDEPDKFEDFDEF